MAAPNLNDWVLSRRLCGLALACSILGASSAASAEEPGSAELPACVKAFEGAQELRLAGRLLESRQQLETCRKEQCKDFIRKSCAQWFGEVTTAISTVSFDVRQGERSVAEFRLLDNGVAKVVRLDGDPLEVDPGEHLFEIQLAGQAPVQKRVTLQPGEKNRLVRVSFRASEPPPSAPARDTVSPWTYVFAGVGALGVSGFAVLGLWGMSRESGLREDCSPNCSASDVDSVRSQYLAADLSLGVGVLALSAGAYLWLSSPTSSDATGTSYVRLSPTTSSEGALLHLGRQF